MALIFIKRNCENIVYKPFIITYTFKKTIDGSRIKIFSVKCLRNKSSFKFS